MGDITIVDDETNGREVMSAQTLPPMSTTERLLTTAVDKGLGIDALEKLIELKNKEEARLAKEAFAKNFARMQGELKPVKKTHDAKKDGKVMYRYASIEDILRENGPIIARHGFSYRWREEESEAGRRFICVVSGYGHTEETQFDTPRITGTSMMNPIQVIASMSTYGRRYSLLLAFGILVEDEDDDAQTLNGSTPVQPANPRPTTANAVPQQQAAPVDHSKDDRATWARPKLIALFAEFSTPTDERGMPVADWLFSDAELADLKAKIKATVTEELPKLYDQMHDQLVDRKKKFFGATK